MKVGDIVYHKTNPEMAMVIYDLDDQDNVWCTWWDGRQFSKDCFVLKELLFDGEQQQKPKAGGKDGS